MSLFLVIISFGFLLSVISIIGGIIMKSSGKASDIRLWWRILMIVAGLVIGAEAADAFMNLNTFFIASFLPFTFRLLFEWYCIALTVAMIIVAGIKSRLNLFEKIFHPGLLLVCLIIALCYDYFVGLYTPLHSYHDILENLTHKDIQVKVFIFLCAFLSTTYMLYVPLFKKIHRKEIKATKWLWIYLFFAILQPVTFFFYAMGSKVSGVILGCGCITFVIIYTISFMRNENPLIQPKEEKKMMMKEKEENTETTPEVKADISTIEIEEKISDLLSSTINDDKLFLNKHFSIEELSIKTAIPLSNIIGEYQKQGFVNFPDYMNSFRLVYFKELQKAHPNVPITVLAADSGFQSRSSFYRFFQQVEGITPLEYKKRNQPT